jgi:hypothetical protein
MKLKFVATTLATLASCTSLFASAKEAKETATFGSNYEGKNKASKPGTSSAQAHGQSFEDSIVYLDKHQGDITSNPGILALRTLENAGKLQIIEELPELLTVIVKTTAATCNTLGNISGIDSCEPDNLDVHVLGWQDKVQPLKSMRGDGRKLVENTPYGITMVKSAQLPPLNGNDLIKICVVDTGYGLNHPDLPNAQQQQGLSGYSPYGSGELWNVDGHGHGSHCAGTIGGVGGNNIGVTSVNPDPSKFTFFIGKGLTNSGSGSGSGVLSAVEKCQEAGAKVISMSLGGGGYSSSADNLYKDLFENKGVLIIAAAGNDGNSALSYPASYDAVMSVAAVDSNKNKASFSQYNNQVEIAAPGVSVQSTITTNSGTGFSYASWSGTSMATPHVAGVAALVWSHFPSCTPYQIRQALIQSAETRNGNCNIQYGFGVVDAKAAYDLLLENGCGGVSAPSASTYSGGCAFNSTLGIAPTPAPTPFNCNLNTFELSLVTDNYGSETSWTLKNSAGSQVASGSGYSSNNNYVVNECVANGCYDFTINDSYGDGICCNYGTGSYSLKFNGNVVGSGGQFGQSETKNICTNASPTTTPAPTTPAPTPAPTTPAPTPGGTCSTNTFVLELTTDNYGSETSWMLKKADGTLVSNGNGYSSNTNYNLPTCVDDGCYEFSITDSYGDGICCSYGSGSYTLKLNGAEVGSGGDFTSIETKSFCAGSTPGPAPTTPAPSPPPTSAVACFSWCNDIPLIPWTSSPGATQKCDFVGYCNGCPQCSA